MNNKEIGTAFEREMCNELAKAGYWVHFITPDRSGRQPFDIIAVRYGVAFALDCKTSVRKSFPITRLEDDQITAFEKWGACGNNAGVIAVKYKDEIYMIPYPLLKAKHTVRFLEDDEVYRWE